MDDTPHFCGTASGRYKALGPSVDTAITDAPQDGAEFVLSKISVPEGGAKNFEQLHASCVPGLPADKSAGRPDTAPTSGGVEKPQEKRTPPLSARVPEEVREIVLQKCKEAHITPNRFVGQAIEAAVFGQDFVIPVSREQLGDLQDVLHLWLVEMSRQGNNLNQLTTNSNRAELRGDRQPEAASDLAKIKQGQKSICDVLFDIQKWILSLKSPFTINDGDPAP